MISIKWPGMDYKKEIQNKLTLKEQRAEQEIYLSRLSSILVRENPKLIE